MRGPVVLEICRGLAVVGHHFPDLASALDWLRRKHPSLTHPDTFRYESETFVQYGTDYYWATIAPEV